MTTASSKRKKKPPKREHAYAVLFLIGRLCWSMAKLAMIVMLTLCLMMLAVVGMMVRGVSQ